MMNNKEFFIVILIGVLGIYYFLNYKRLREKYETICKNNNRDIAKLKNELKKRMYSPYKQIPYDMVVNIVHDDHDNCDDHKENFNNYMDMGKIKEVYNECDYDMQNTGDNQIMTLTSDKNELEKEFAKREMDYNITENILMKEQIINEVNNNDQNKLEEYSLDKKQDDNIDKTDNNIDNVENKMEMILEDDQNTNVDTEQNFISLNCGLKIQPMQKDWKKFLIH